MSVANPDMGIMAKASTVAIPILPSLMRLTVLVVILQRLMIQFAAKLGLSAVCIDTVIS